MARKSATISTKTTLAKKPRNPQTIRRTAAGATVSAGRVKTELPRGYVAVLADLKRRIVEERLRTVLAANSAMVMLYWDIGNIILGQSKAEGLGGKSG